MVYFSDFRSGLLPGYRCSIKIHHTFLLHNTDVMYMGYVCIHFLHRQATGKESSDYESIHRVTCLCRATESREKSNQDHFHCCWNLCFVLVAAITSSDHCQSFQEGIVV